jgi:hypothetical protein
VSAYQRRRLCRAGKRLARAAALLAAAIAVASAVESDSIGRIVSSVRDHFLRYPFLFGTLTCLACFGGAVKLITRGWELVDWEGRPKLGWAMLCGSGLLWSLGMGLLFLSACVQMVGWP